MEEVQGLTHSQQRSLRKALKELRELYIKHKQDHEILMLIPVAQFPMRTVITLPPMVRMLERLNAKPIKRYDKTYTMVDCSRPVLDHIQALEVALDAADAELEGTLSCVDF